MASSSSAHKVARVAAKSGPGQHSNKAKNWLFPLAIVALVVLGVGIVAVARSQNQGSGDNTTPPRANLQDGKPSDHWHQAFAVNICGREQPAFPTTSTDPLGIHTHGDGLIHIHPFTVRAAGSRATMSKFWDLMGLTVTDDGIKMPDGKIYKEGATTCDGKPAELVMAYWKDVATAETAKPTKIYRSNFSSVAFTHDLGAYTLAFVPKGTTEIPAPSSSQEALNPSDVGSAGG